MRVTDGVQPFSCMQASIDFLHVWKAAAVMSASHLGGVATVFCPQGLGACAGQEFRLPVFAEANSPTRSSMPKVMFGRPVGVGRREEPAMFERRLPAGVKSLGLDATILVSSGCR